MPQRYDLALLRKRIFIQILKNIDFESYHNFYTLGQTIKMKNHLTCIFLFLAIVMFSSCVSNKSFQTARTTNQGELGYGFGLAVPELTYIPDATDLGGIAGELFARYGITEKLDIGINVTLLGTSGLDLKYQYLGDKESAFAGALGFSFATSSIENNNVNSTTYDITLPAYFSYHAGDALALYASPRVVQRVSENNGTFGGIIGGTRIGTERFAVFAEYVYLHSAKGNYSNHKQLNIGIGFGIN